MGLIIEGFPSIFPMVGSVGPLFSATSGMDSAMNLGVLVAGNGWNQIVSLVVYVPENGWIIRENRIKMDDLGIQLFLETPI